MVIGYKNDRSTKEKLFIPAELPILPLRGTVAYPDLIIPLVVGREKSIKLVDEAMSRDRLIGIITQKNPDIEEPGLDDLYTVGCVFFRLFGDIKKGARIKGLYLPVIDSPHGQEISPAHQFLKLSNT